MFVEHGGARNEYNLLVRGFNARRVPVFMDGIPVYVPYDGEMDLGRLPPLIYLVLIFLKAQALCFMAQIRWVVQ